MKKILGLIAIVSMLIMVIPMAAPMVKGAGQPPIVLNTYYEGTIGWGPVDADPVFCYDTASGQLLFNAYENLIAFHGEEYYQFDPQLATNIPTRVDHTFTVTSTSAVGDDPTGSTWTDGVATYTVTGWTDELMNGFGSGDAIRMTDGTTWRTYTALSVTGTSPTMTMQLWYGTYTFNLQTTTINFYDHTGAVYDTFGLKDVIYCMQRLMVFDKSGYPSWMFDKPLLDVADHSVWTNSTAMELAHLINDMFVGSGNTFTLYEGVQFPDNAFKQILANTWGSIYSSKYYKDMGNWQGDLFSTVTYGGPFPDWWIQWANKGLGMSLTNARKGIGDAGLDQIIPTSYCGSGPYYIQTIDAVNFKVIFQRNPGYWGGWPAAGNTPVAPATGYLDTYEVDYISDWTTRKADFLGGLIDSCAVPRGNMFEIIDPVTKQPTTPGIKTIANIVPALSFDSNMFCFDVQPGSTYVGTNSFPDGIPNDFFNNTHVRKAFAYSFNYSNYNTQVYFGESDYRANFLCVGLYPDYYNASIPVYYESMAQAKNELQQAVVDGQNVWNSGFTLDITFNTGNTVRQTACQMVADFFTALSTYGGRSGLPPFKVVVKEITWSQTINDYYSSLLPMFDIGWLADFADADDFARPYMYSYGAFAYYQFYTAANGWGTDKDIILDTAILTPDGPARQALYQQLQMYAYNDVPFFPVVNPRGRLFQWYWVKGWYYDAVYPARRIYTTWKQDTPWYDVSGTTLGVSDNKVNMRDIAYLIAHFNAKAPIPGVALDPKWVGVYGANGAVDPYGDRKSDMKDIAGAIQNFNAQGPGHP